MKRATGARKSIRPDDGGTHTRALAKGLLLLERLAETQSPMSLKQLSADIDLGKASALRLLRTLESAGYISRDPATDLYILEAEWPDSGRREQLRRLRDIALPHMRELNAHYGETVALAYLFADQIRVVEVIESTQHIRMSNYKGRVLQPYASSLGKAIAAFQTPAEIQTLIHTYGVYALTPKSLTDYRKIQEDLAGVRERGFAWDNEETAEGGTCCGAPITARNGQVVASLSISMPSVRFTAHLRQVLPPIVRESAQKISNGLATE
jgi:IclR family acetate operon transcriptional repressor